MNLKDITPKPKQTHKFKVGQIVLHKDGQYECEVLEQIPPLSDIDAKNPSYKLKDCANGSTFKECQSYLKRNG